MRARHSETEIRSAISAGEFAPGEKLNESTIAARFGVSRNTLRESFATLVAEGLLVKEPHRGVFIASPTAADIRDIYAARAAVEPPAARWGEALDLDGLEEVVEQAEDALYQRDLEAVARHNQDFHRLLVQGLGSASLDILMEQLLARMRLAFLIVAHDHPSFHAQFVPHNRATLSLISEGHRADAGAHVRRTLLRTRDTILELYPA